MKNSTNNATQRSIGLRVAAYLFSLLALINPVVPALADVLSDITIQRDLNDSPIYIPASNANYQFAGPEFIEWSAAGTKSLENVYDQLIKEYHQAISEPTLVPIMTGGITIFIPTYTRYKYMGTPVVQARYIRTQVEALLGRSKFKYSSESAMISALYNNAVTYMKNGHALFGDRLGVSQYDNNLTQDMIMPELRRINGKDVIVPVVYLKQQTVNQYKIQDSVEELASVVEFKALRVKNASIEVQRDSFINVLENISLDNTELSSDKGNLTITAGGHFDNTSSNINANGDLVIGAKSFTSNTIVYRYDIGHEQGSRYGQIASVDASGDLLLDIQNDIVINGTHVSAGSTLQLKAGGDIHIGAQKLYDAFSRSGHSRSEVSYLKSLITAEDTISLIAGGEISIRASDVISDSGVIEILSANGIYILNEFGETYEQMHSKVGKTTTDMSHFQTFAIRAALKAGKGVNINTLSGPVVLRAVDVDSQDGATVTAQNGQVHLLLAKEQDQYSYSQVKKSLLTIKTETESWDKDNAVYNTIVGGVEINATRGVVVEYAGLEEGDRDAQLAALANLPGMDWINLLGDGCDVVHAGQWTDELPMEEKQQLILEQACVDYSFIELMDQYSYDKSTNLSPAAMAIISIALAVATGGSSLALTSGTSVLGSVGVTIGAKTVMSAAVNAAFTTLVTQAAIGITNGALNGDSPYQIWKDLGSKENVRSLATSMLTAGALSYANDLMQLESISVLSAGADELNFIGQAVDVVTTATINAGIDVLVQGGSLSDFEDQFKVSLLQGAVSALGKAMAKKIGEFAKSNVDDNFATFTKYLGHAAVGCVIGLGKDAINDESDEQELACASGAGGAVVGELIAERYEAKAIKNFIEEERASFDEGVTPEMVKIYVESEFAQSYYADTFAQMKENGVDIAKLSAAFMAFVAGGDVNIAAATAENAAENNALFLIPFAIMAIKAIDIALTANELWEIHQLYESGQTDEANKALAEFIGPSIAAKAIPGFKTAEELFSYLRSKGILSQKTIDTINNTFNKKKCRLSCFVGGTKVAVADGFSNIEDVSVGDEVWARDPTSGLTALQPVIDTIKNPVDEVWQLEFVNPDGDIDVHEVTASHPYYEVNAGWQTVADLEIASIVNTRDNRNAILISKLNTGEVVTTYTLDVFGIDSYFVGSGEVLVHNCDDELSSPNPLPRSIREAYEEIKLGRGTPNLDSNGVQKIFQGRENRKWAGATEWLVPGDNGAHHRILKLGDKLGFVKNHDYSKIKTFPGPWYPEGGKK